jgi:hypothetical protein
LFDPNIWQYVHISTVFLSSCFVVVVLIGEREREREEGEREGQRGRGGERRGDTDRQIISNIIKRK